MTTGGAAPSSTRSIRAASSDSNGDGVGDLAGITEQARLRRLARRRRDLDLAVLPLADARFRLRRRRLLRRRSAVRHARGFRPPARARPRARPQGDDRPGAAATPPTEHAWFRESRASRANRASRLVRLGRRRGPTARRPTTGSRSSAARPGAGSRAARQYYLHNFLAEQPTSTSTIPTCVDALLASVRLLARARRRRLPPRRHQFLLHDRAACATTRRARRPDGAAPAKPFALAASRLRHDASRRPAVAAAPLARARRPLPRHRAARRSLEPGRRLRAHRASYTAGGDGLHMAYTLRPLRSAISARRCAARSPRSPRRGDDGWLCWSFSNHDVERAASRWNPAPQRRRPPDPAFARCSLRAAARLRGSVCLYQGEELGLTEAALAFADLRDPFGIAFCPEFSGRDGCRTPMPWRADAGACRLHHRASRGCRCRPSTAPPASPRRSATRASPLHAWRRLIAWRKAHPALQEGDLAARSAGAAHRLRACRRGRTAALRIQSERAADTYRARRLSRGSRARRVRRCRAARRRQDDAAAFRRLLRRAGSSGRSVRRQRRGQCGSIMPRRYAPTLSPFLEPHHHRLTRAERDQPDGLDRRRCDQP